MCGKLHRYIRRETPTLASSSDLSRCLGADQSSKPRKSLHTAMEGPSSHKKLQKSLLSLAHVQEPFPECCQNSDLSPRRTQEQKGYPPK